MPKRLRTEVDDFNVNALRVVQEATGQIPRAEPPTAAPTATRPRPKAKARPRRKDPAAVALGRKGGKASGKARMIKISPDRRSEIARAAARARWHSPKAS